MSNDARHRDIAALLARGVIRLKRNPLAAKVIEFHMPENKAYSDEQPSEAFEETSTRAKSPIPKRHDLSNHSNRSRLRKSVCVWLRMV